MLSTEIIPLKNQNARIENNYLIIDDDISLKEWKEIGKNLSSMQGNIQFWIGDWARFGTKKGYYTDSAVYDEIEEITGLDRTTIKDYKYVAESVPSSLRNDHVSYNHHKAVAKLTDDKQIYFLNRAAQEKLSVAELRLQIYHDTTIETPNKNISYNNQNPFPVRLGHLHLKLQEEAFEKKTSIHNRIVDILEKHFEAKEKISEAVEV